MNETNALLSLISDWDVLKSEGCAHSIRENGRSVERLSTKNIEIRAKKDGSGLDIYVAAAARGEKVAIPACITASHIDDLVYNDFHIAEGADVTIIAGCGIPRSSWMKTASSRWTPARSAAWTAPRARPEATLQKEPVS